jgi:hypothetical protein
MSDCAPLVSPRARVAVLRPLAVAMLLVLFCGLAPVALALAPRPGEPVVVLTLRPDGSIPASVLASDAAILAASAEGHAVVLASASPGLVDELYRHGATLVLAAAPLSGCLPLRLSATHFSQGAP